MTDFEPVTWTDADLGRAFREALSAAAAAGYRRPSLMPITEGWEATAYRPAADRRFRPPSVRVIHRNPEMAYLLLADKIRESA